MFVPVIDAVAYDGEEQIAGDRGRDVPGQPACYLRGSTRSTGGPARRQAARHPCGGSPGRRPARRAGSGSFLGAGRTSRNDGPFERGRAGARLRGVRSGERARSASASKSSVILLARDTCSMTVRPSLAARTKSRPPDRIRASAGIPTVRSMSATDTPLLARLTTSASRPDAQLDRDLAELDRGPQGGDVRGDRDEDPVGPLEDRPVEGAVRRVQVDDDEVVARARAVIASATRIGLEVARC